MHDSGAGKPGFSDPKTELSTCLQGKRQLQCHAAGGNILAQAVLRLGKACPVVPGDPYRAAHETSFFTPGGPDSSRRESHRADDERSAEQDQHRRYQRVASAELGECSVQDLPAGVHTRHFVPGLFSRTGAQVYEYTQLTRCAHHPEGGQSNATVTGKYWDIRLNL